MQEIKKNCPITGRDKEKQAQICAEGCEEEYITHIFWI